MRDRYITVAEAARRLGISRDAVYRYIKGGLLPSVMPEGGKRGRLVPAIDVQRLGPYARLMKRHRGHPPLSEPTERQKQVLELVGTLRDTDIARRIGISRERVRQIKAKLGLCKVMGPRPVHKCRKCGYPIPGTTQVTCNTCKLETELKSFYLVTCSYCGRTVIKPPTEYNAAMKHGYKNFYCNRVCLGKDMARKYGFAAQIAKGTYVLPPVRHKYDYDMVWRLHTEGTGAAEIAERLHAPRCSIDDIIRKLRAKAGMPPRRRGPMPGTRRGPYRPRPGKECLACGTMHTRRGWFCSVKCYDRLRAIYKYYTGQYKGGGGIKECRCSVCGAVVVRRASPKYRPFCDRCLQDYRRGIGRRLAERRQSEA